MKSLLKKLIGWPKKTSETAITNIQKSQSAADDFELRPVSWQPDLDLRKDTETVAQTVPKPVKQIEMSLVTDSEARVKSQMDRDRRQSSFDFDSDKQSKD